MDVSNKSAPASKSSATGAAIEKIALQYLCSRGLLPVATNFRCVLGEIDLIMSDAKTLVFVEVRYRKYREFGGGAASVTPSKQRKIAQAARWYLQKKNIESPCRFDVVDVCGSGPDPISSPSSGAAASHGATDKPQQGYQINWISNAFLPAE